VVEGADGAGLARTTAVAFDVAVERPEALDARSTTRNEWPTSADFSV
jgi:hypothetical protein